MPTTDEGRDRAFVHGGTSGGRPILPATWGEYARIESPVPSGPGEQPYGARRWRFPRVPGSFAAPGCEGQRTMVVPDLDRVVVRLGRTPVALKPNLDAWMAALVDTRRPG